MDTNNITKEDALAFTRGIRNQRELVDNIINVTLYGKEHKLMYDDAFAMSKICRAFNITEYGVNRAKNRIKGRYQKYEKKEGIEDYMRRILQDNCPGFVSEEPRMDNLLAQYPEVNIYENNEPVYEPPQQMDDPWDQIHDQLMQSQANSENTSDTLGSGTPQGNPMSLIVGIAVIAGVIAFLKWNPVLLIILLIIGGVVVYQLKRGNSLRAMGQTSSTRRIVLGALGIFFAFLVISGIKGAMVDDSESTIMIIVYAILALLCFRGAMK